MKKGTKTITGMDSKNYVRYVKRKQRIIYIKTQR